MALIVNLKSVENLRGKADRIVKVTFRGLTQQSKIVHSAKKVAYFGESFEWPIARASTPDENVEIQLYNYNRYLNNKLVGSYTLLLQSLVEEGEIKIFDSLIDINNRLLEATISFDVQYFSPDGKVGQWGNEEFKYPLLDQIQKQDKHEGSDGESSIGLPSALLETQSLRYGLSDDGSTIGDRGWMDDFYQPEDNVSQVILADAVYGPKKARPLFSEQELYKPRDFQVCITIHEARQLAGLDIDPVIRVQVGDDHKYTSIKRSINNPYYNEYFVFDFHESPAMVFDKMITLTATHSIAIPGRQVLKAGNILAGRTIGTFKCDVGTVYAAPSHQFYHKWAVLLNPKDISEGPKGCIKCDLVVMGRGDIIKTPKIVKEEEDNIEGNLLLPAGVPMERQRCLYSVTIFRGEDLPRADFGIMASVRKVITSASVALIDAFVKVSFVGHIGKTSVKKNYHPEWREILTFVDMFPPLCNRIKVELQDYNAISDDNIGTHFIELSQIMDPGGDISGILPTFGPSWVNFYGAPREYKMVGIHDALNEGLGEGVAYRGRVLLQIKTTLIEGELGGPSKCIREKLRTSSRADHVPRREFLLFATIFKANMIDRELKNKQISFEISMGNYGNVLDAKPEKPLNADSDDEDFDDDENENSKMLKKMKEEEENLPAHSLTDPRQPLTQDKNYYFMPYNESKPCLWVVCKFEDVRKRLFHSNVLERIADPFDEGLEDVRLMLREDHISSHRRLRGVLDEFMVKCDIYLKHAATLPVGAGSGKTKLDMFRLKTCRNNVDKFRTRAGEMKRQITQDNVKPRYRECREISRKLRRLCKEPQDSMPDIFVWMICDKKRVAYQRIPARHLIHATQKDFIGKHSGKIQTLYLRKPGKSALGAKGWVMQATLDTYLWFGERDPNKRIQHYIEKLPPGYSPITETETPPKSIYYEEKHVFQFRAHIFQARSLIGSDDTGLSDPFARIVIGNQCKATHVVHETLSPIWDETLAFVDVELFGPIDLIRDNPPTVIVEIFDHDLLGKPEFLGRSLVKPKVKLETMPYMEPEFPPELEWWDVCRGPRVAGELMAAFELLQGPSSEFPTLPVAIEKGKQIMVTPMPKAIRPTCSMYRIEVLFWGVRNLKRLQLMSIDNPRVDVQCAIHPPLSSKQIVDISKNCNFEDNLRYMDVMLPDNEMFWPPLTVRVVDCRNFGRELLVGIATISDLTKYMWESQEEKKRRAEEKRRRQELLENRKKYEKRMAEEREALLNGTATLDANGQPVPMTEQTPNGKQVQGQTNQTQPGDVVITIEGTPGDVTFKPGDPGAPPNGQGGIVEEPKKIKKHRDLIEDLDWWSKYYVTREELHLLKKKVKEAQKREQAEKEKESEEDDEYYDDSDAIEIDAVDYSTLDAAKLKEARELLSVRIEEDEKTKKRRKKKRKKKKKKNRIKQMKGLYGRINDAFKKDDLDDDYDLVNPADTEEMEDKTHIERIKVYEMELEKVPEFGGLSEWTNTYEIYRGKKMDDEEDDSNRVSGLFKGTFCIYKAPRDEPRAGTTPKHPYRPALKLHEGLPSFKPQEVNVKIYILQAYDLHPTDPNGKSDPYIVIKLGKKEVVDKDNRKNNTLEPVWGKVFEFDAQFPMESMLTIQVVDYDTLSSDDLIGQTTIDLENRLFTKHRATCGISRNYEIYGYNIWRDPAKPSQILDKLCKKLKMNPPEYRATDVRFGGKIFYASDKVENELGEVLPTNDHLALEVLKHFDEVPGGIPIVPEHIEARPLYNPDDRPDVPQGKLEMWIDMFPKEAGPPPQITVDITPREPKGYELRVIVWNTDAVKSVDKNILTGEESSDIFVKGYLKGVGEDNQQTDVHYRSLTGTGNFNWRFLFPFDYLKAEERMVFKKRMSLFDLNLSEFKKPCYLTLQVWDADLISRDDFLGAVTLDLNKMPMPAKDPKKCTWKKFLEFKKTGKLINLFKNKRCKGWYPVVAQGHEDEDSDDESEGPELTGKVEVEFHLLTTEEAEKAPAGKAREEPDQLAEPNRPDSSFLWILNPMKTFKYVFWKNYKWLLCKILCLAVLILFFALFLYGMPASSWDAIFGSI